MHAKALRIRFTGLKSAELQDVLSARLLVRRVTYARVQMFSDVWEEGRRTATAVEAQRGAVADHDTRALNPSSKSTDVKPGTATCVENSADKMDEDTSLRTPATS